eukprot:980246-Rhodomonas_salina.1
MSQPALGAGSGGKVTNKATTARHLVANARGWYREWCRRRPLLPQRALPHPSPASPIPRVSTIRKRSTIPYVRTTLDHLLRQHQVLPNASLTPCSMICASSPE